MEEYILSVIIIIVIIVIIYSVYRTDENNNSENYVEKNEEDFSNYIGAFNDDYSNFDYNELFSVDGLDDVHKKNVKYRSRRFDHNKFRDSYLKQLKIKTDASLKYEDNREMKPGLANF